MKIVIAEDHLMFREILRKVCAKELGHEVVGEADDGRAAVELVRTTAPDLMLLDLRLPSLDGFGVAREARAIAPRLKIVILSSRCDRFTIMSAERAGVNGFVDKNTNTVAILKEAITAVAAGRTWFSKEYQRARAERLADPQAIDKILSEHERRALAVLGTPHNLAETAAILDINIESVEKLRLRLTQKLGLGTTAELVRYAQANGFTLPATSGGGGRLLP